MDKLSQENIQIINLLLEYNKRVPGLRFGQILTNLYMTDIEGTSNSEVYAVAVQAMKEEQDNV